MCFLGSKYARNAFAARTPLGELTALPRPPSCILKEWEEKGGREGWEGRERKGKGRVGGKGRGGKGREEGEGKGREGGLTPLFCTLHRPCIQ